MRKFLISALIVVVVVVAFSSAPAFAAQSCENLASVKIADGTITSAAAVPAGPFTPPGGPGPFGAPRPIDLPAFCRVQLTVTPSVKIEVWMPMTGWNGNFQAVGNNGYAGNIVYAAMATALRAGFATANTDTGHEASKADWAFGTDAAAKQRITDFGYRAVHEMTLKAKQLIEAYYGNAPKLSYFNGCSTGGRQALTEAQRYPEDFNGILAGAPAVNWSQQMVSHVWIGLVTTKDQDNYIPAAKLPAIQSAAMDACDTLDGLKDGLITDPRKCKYDPAVLLCKSGDSASCLSMKQIDSLKAIYAPLDDPKGKFIYPGHVPGAESGWDRFLTGAAPGKGLQFDLGVSYMKYFVLEDPNWDFHSWDFAKDLPRVDSNWTRGVIDSMNMDLRPFRDHGSKLILYQGWGDDTVSPLNTISYYKGVVAKVTGGKAGDAYAPETPDFDRAAEQTGGFFRLFMIPGMNHCGGGPGPNVFDGMASLTNWVENKQPPEKIVASHLTNNATDRTRPLCPFPQTAQYTGQGSMDDAANFVCKLPN